MRIKFAKNKSFRIERDFRKNWLVNPAGRLSVLLLNGAMTMSIEKWFLKWWKYSNEEVAAAFTLALDFILVWLLWFLEAATAAGRNRNWFRNRYDTSEVERTESLYIIGLRNDVSRKYCQDDKTRSINCNLERSSACCDLMEGYWWWLQCLFLRWCCLIPINSRWNG